jgi:carbamoyltransferase
VSAEGSCRRFGSLSLRETDRLFLMQVKTSPRSQDKGTAMVILGLSPFRHHPSAVLLQDGTVRAAIENEKLSRSGAEGVPNEAIRFCLESVGATWSDLDAITIATRPIRGWLRRSWLRAKLSARAPIAGAYYEAKEIGNLARELKDLRLPRRKDGTHHRTLYFDHHLCHAACAFFQSPFDRALIITMDEGGDGDSGMIAIGQGQEIRVLRKINFQDSLAAVYSRVTSLIGFVPHREEQKTQWLSLEGEPEFEAIFLNMLRNPRSVLPRLDHSFVNKGFTKWLTFSSKFYQQTGLPVDPKQLGEGQRRALASSIQAACAEVVSILAENLSREHGIAQVCLAGGLFQNPLLVGSVEKKLGMGRVFVPPVPGNAGTAVGAAQLAWHQVLDKPRSEPVSHVYLGPKFSGQQAKDVLDNSKARYILQTTEDRKLDAAVQLLMAGKIVGWVQGACEFGPRALGNRSVLASPWAPYVRENLNDYIKLREWFRPFAISVTEEDCHRFFECSRLCRFMNSIGWIRANSSVLPEGFLLPGGRVRLHVVQRSSNYLFWRLLKRFGEQAAAPMLVNTSFNMFGDPLVVSPRDAIRSYFCSGIDALVIDNFVLSKGSNPLALKPIAASRVGDSA